MKPGGHPVSSESCGAVSSVGDGVVSSESDDAVSSVSDGVVRVVVQ